MNKNRRAIALAFGAAMKDMRRELGLSQEKLAQRAKFDRTFPSLMERGLRCATLDTFMSVAESCEVPPARLFARFLEKLAVRS